MWSSVNDGNFKDVDGKFEVILEPSNGINQAEGKKRSWVKKIWKKIANSFPPSDTNYKPIEGSPDSKLFYFDAYNQSVRDLLNSPEKRKYMNQETNKIHYVAYIALPDTGEYTKYCRYVAVFNWIDGPYGVIECYHIVDYNNFDPEQAFYYYMAEGRSYYDFSIIHGDCPLVKTLKDLNVDVKPCNLKGLADGLYDTLYNPFYINWGHKSKFVIEDLEKLYPDETPEDRNNLFGNIRTRTTEYTGVIKPDVLDDFAVFTIKAAINASLSFDFLYDTFNMRTSKLENKIKMAFSGMFPDLYQAPKAQAIENDTSTNGENETVISTHPVDYTPKLNRNYAVADALPRGKTLAQIYNESDAAANRTIAYNLAQKDWKETSTIVKPFKFIYNKIAGVETIDPKTVVSQDDIDMVKLTCILMNVKYVVETQGQPEWKQASKEMIENFEKDPDALYNVPFIEAYGNSTRTDGYLQGREDSLLEIAEEKRKYKEIKDLYDALVLVVKELKLNNSALIKNNTQLGLNNQELQKKSDEADEIDQVNKNLIKQVDELQEENKIIKADKNTNDTALAKTREKLQKTKEKKKKYKGEKIELEIKNTQLESDKRNLEGELKDKKLEFTDLQIKNNHAQARIDKMIPKKKNYKAWAKGNQSEVINLTRNITSLEANISNLMSWLKGNTTYVNELFENYTAAKDMIENTTHLNEDLTSWLSGNTSALADFNTSTGDKLASQQRHYTTIIYRLTNLLSVVNDTVKWSKDRWLKAEDRMEYIIKNTKGKNTQELAKQVISDIGDYNEIIEYNTTSEETIKSLTKQGDILRDNITTLQSTVKRLEKAIKTKDDEIRGLKGNITSLQGTVEDAQEDVNETGMDYNASNAKIDILNREIKGHVRTEDNLRYKLELATNQSKKDRDTIESLNKQVKTKETQKQTPVPTPSPFISPSPTPVPTPYPNITPIYKPTLTPSPTPKIKTEKAKAPSFTLEQLSEVMGNMIDNKLKQFRPPPRNMNTDLIGKGYNKYDVEDVYEGKRTDSRIPVSWLPPEQEQSRQEKSYYNFPGFNISQGSATSGESIPPPPLVVYYPVSRRRKI